MRKILWPWWTVLLWIAIWVVGVLAVTIAHAGCVRTATEAAALTKDGVTLSGSGDGGFRVMSTRWDPVLRRRWALIASCGHPEWPTVALPVSGLSMADSAAQRMTGLPVETSQRLPSVPTVRAGDAVQLRMRQGDLHIDAAAIAEQSGALGQTIRVRLMQRKTLGQQIAKEFSGVVRGPHEVEISQ